MKPLLGMGRLVAVVLLLIGAALIVQAVSGRFEVVTPIHTGSSYVVVLGWRAVVVAVPVAVVSCAMALAEPKRFWPGVAGLLLAPVMAGYLFTESVAASSGSWGIGAVAYQDGFRDAMLSAVAILAGSLVWITVSVIANWSASPAPIET